MSMELFESIPSVTIGTKKEIMEELTKLGVEKIKRVEEIPGKIGITLKVVSETEKEYYIGISSYGFLEIIREDSKTGKIVYMPIDD